VTRAVIDLQGDTSPVMPRINKIIEGCSYSPEKNILGFSYKGLGVIVEPKRITINNAADEATAKEVMDWFIKISEDSERSRNN
jgi:hypothetical protein